MNLRKTFFILPNLFTLANVFCGFFALTLSAGDASANELYQAALAICFGFFFDLFDGRVARLTRTQSDLGVQLDSLADAITFGAAPAMLVYKWGLTSFGLAGIFIAFSFIAGGVLRLARFNVLATRKEKATVKSGGRAVAAFIGLPIPAAASVIVALVVVNHSVGGNIAVAQSAIATVVLILAYLMISRVRFRSFKDLRLTKRSLGVIFLIAMISVLILTHLRASFIFIFLISAYIALGLTEEVVRFAAERRRARREAKLRAGEPLTADDEDAIDDEDEVLRELTGIDEYAATDADTATTTDAAIATATDDATVTDDATEGGRDASSPTATPPDDAATQ